MVEEKIYKITIAQVHNINNGVNGIIIVFDKDAVYILFIGITQNNLFITIIIVCRFLSSFIV